jgi:hypothetical protein
MLIVRFTKQIDGYLCAYCVKYWFKAFTVHNLVFGWWGVISALLTVVYTIGNVVNYLRATSQFQRLH